MAELKHLAVERCEGTEKYLIKRKTISPDGKSIVINAQGIPGLEFKSRNTAQKAAAGIERVIDAVVSGLKKTNAQ